tara:strand:+ start:532 stop:909 length:378 start_codon:yes stop_codon:yes gene_type:complete
MTLTLPTVEELTVRVDKEVQVEASVEQTYAALLEQIGPANEAPDGTPLPMVIEPRPGGRWFRDLGNDNGHHWEHVQAIKRPTLLEISGPMFMSYAATANIQIQIGGAGRRDRAHDALQRLRSDSR